MKVVHRSKAAHPRYQGTILLTYTKLEIVLGVLLIICNVAVLVMLWHFALNRPSVSSATPDQVNYQQGSAPSY